MAMGGAGIVSGMSPKGSFDEVGSEQVINVTRNFKNIPSGCVEIYFNETGFFSVVLDEEIQVLDAIKDYMKAIPAYDPMFFRAVEPSEPKYPPSEIASIVPINQKVTYDFEQVLSRLVNNSEHMKSCPSYGPEVYAGLVKSEDHYLTVLISRVSTALRQL
jgi:glutaconyl-CoA decarboxylase